MLSLQALADSEVYRVTTQNGLTSNTVTCISKDSHGFIWMGTKTGLSRFDGLQVRNYPFREDYPHISQIEEVFTNMLAVVNGRQLLAFDMVADRLLPVVYTNGQGVECLSMAPIDSTSVWVLTDVGVQLLALSVRESGRIVVEIMKNHTPLAPKGRSFKTMAVSPNGDALCLCDQSGTLYFFNMAKGEVYRTVKLEMKNTYDINRVRWIKDRLWVCTTAYGVFAVNVNTGGVQNLTHGKGSQNRMSHTDVFDVVAVGANRLVAVTWDGYTILDTDANHPDVITSRIDNLSSQYSQNNYETRMISACYDDLGNVWIGTDGGGLMKWNVHQQVYNRYYQSSSNEINAILSDDDGYVWMATFHRGIMKSRRPLSMGPLEFDEVDNSGTTVFCAVKDKGGRLWFGNKNGRLTLCDPRSGATEQVELSPDGQPNNTTVHCLALSRTGTILVGTDNGLLRFDPKSRSCSRIRLNITQSKGTRKGPQAQPVVMTVLEMPDTTLWVGTGHDGIMKVRRNGYCKTGFERGWKIQDLTVRAMMLSREHVLYVGYEGGFALVDPHEERMLDAYTTAQGLCNNFVGCIGEDVQGRIWIGSNSAVSRFSRHQKIFYNYYISGSNRSVACIDGMLFWGNNRNLTYFDPNDVSAPILRGTTVFTALEVNNRAVATGDTINGQVVLPKSLLYMKKIVLNNENRNFSLMFSSLSFSEHTQKYQYRLVPYQTEWMMADGSEKVSYANLPADEYTFEVRALTPNDSYGTTSSLTIVVKPHWSRTWWFVLLVAGLVVAVAGGLVYGVKHRSRPNSLQGMGAERLSADEANSNLTANGTAAAVEDSFLVEVRSVIETHLGDETFGVKTLAEKMCMSQPTLYRKLRERTDVSAIDMIRSMRMEHAERLVVEGRLTIQEITERVGYTDVRTLRKHFVERYGVPPSKYVPKYEARSMK